MICKDEAAARTRFNDTPSVFPYMTQQNTTLLELDKYDEYMMLAQIRETDFLADTPPELRPSTILDSTSETAIYTIAVREKNAVVTVTASAMVGNLLSFETGLAAEDILQEALRYTEMVMSKLNNR